MKKADVKLLTILGLLIAVQIVLSRFCSVSAWNFKIGFSFVPVVIAAILYGAKAAAAVAGIGDFVGAILIPIGPYFPGFTFTAVLCGICFGLLLHRAQTLGKILAAVAVTQLAGSLLLNSLWISLLYGTPYAVLLGTRVVQCAVVAPVQLFTIALLAKLLAQYQRRLVA